MFLILAETLYNVFHAYEDCPWPVAMDERIGGRPFNVTIDVSL